MVTASRDACKNWSSCDRSSHRAHQTGIAGGYHHGQCFEQRVPRHCHINCTPPIFTHVHRTINPRLYTPISTLSRACVSSERSHSSILTLRAILFPSLGVDSLLSSRIHCICSACRRKCAYCLHLSDLSFCVAV